MNFLNKEKGEARWLSVVLGVLVALSYAFANINQIDMLFGAMPLLTGMEINAGIYALSIIMGAGFKYVIFILFISLSYSMAYRSLVNKTRDIKVMPISKESYVNHIEFVTIIANIVIGAISYIYLYNPLVGLVLNVITTILIKLASYLVALWLLTRVGIGECVKQKVFGGFLTSLSVFAVMML